MKLYTLIALAGTLAAQGSDAATLPRSVVHVESVRTFARSCKSIRPIAVKTAVKNGWKVDASTLIGNVTAPEGVIRFAEGNRECDVYVKNAPRETGEQILRDIASVLRKSH